MKANWSQNEGFDCSFGGPEYVLPCLGRYTHRVAISNYRLASLANGQVNLGWRDWTHHNEQKLMTSSEDSLFSLCVLEVPLLMSRLDGLENRLQEAAVFVQRGFIVVG
ncbi:MAG: transposase [Candidatus Sulfotelmatobacter sp.]